MPDPVKDPQGGPGGTGDKDAQGGDPGKPNEPGDAGKKSADGGGDNPGDTQYITPTILTNLMNADKRKTQEQFKKMTDQNSALQASIEDMKKLLADKDAGTSGKGGDKGGKSKEPDSTEVIELRRRIDELTEKGKASDDRATTERELRVGQEFKNTVIAALTSAGCEMPEEAFLVIRPRLQHDAENQKIFATVETETYGREELDLKTFIEREFRENILPHVFKGKMRTGGAAGGDTGSGGGYQFTKEQAFDPAAYIADPDKHRKAIEQGRVKGVKKPAGV